eukprot:GHUV01013287.1.p1 GENE.GHUV01013287.1~~GHUV01013287.1.p1  ORF type:complete len:203 (+),score=48.07 GHUV01013287.1:1383-1991(+)
MKGSQSFGDQQSSSGPGEWRGKHALVYLIGSVILRTGQPGQHQASCQALHSTSHSTLSAANLGGQTSLQPAAAAAVPAKRPPNQKQFICVGEFQLANKLALLSEMYDSDVKPVDLRRAWSDPAHAFDEHVRAAVAKLYTYLPATQTCYGFLSCWYVTWLVCCPLGDRAQLYISAPLLASTRYTSWAPAVTTRGALSWLQSMR